MKHNRFFAVVLCLIILFSALTTVHTSAENIDSAAAKAQDFIGGIASYKQSSNMQTWISNGLANGAGNTSEWYVLALSQYGNYDFSAYKNNLLAFLSSNDVPSASSRLKYALCLSAVGSTDSYIGKVAGEAIGKQGIMSWVFGLHLLNNIGTATDREPVITKLLSLQLSDGGFAISGSYGDVDVTAMTIAPLAPYYNSNAKVKSAVNRAITFLSERQQADGDFASYGICNPESTAQVLVALSALRIDASSDARFIKNGHTVFDGIEKYRLGNGAFSHEYGKAANENATVQVFYSMVSYLRFARGQSPLFVLDNAKPVKIIVPATENASKPESNAGTKAPNGASASGVKPQGANAAATQKSNAPTGKGVPVTNTKGETIVLSDAKNPSDASNEQISGTPADSKNTADKAQDKAKDTAQKGTDSPKVVSKYKTHIIIGIVAVGVLACGFLVVRKKGNTIIYISILVVTALCSVAVGLSGTSIFGPKAPENPANKAVVGQVTISIRCDTIVGKKESEYVPKDGIILDTTEVDIAKGDTVYDVLVAVTKENSIQMKNKGMAGMAYISGINNLYEFDYGGMSGWIYQVNGETPGVGCNKYDLSPGDVIVWHYTCDLGEDIPTVKSDKK